MPFRRIVEIKHYLDAQASRPRRAARRARAFGRALPAGGRLQHQIQARRAAEDGRCSAISSARMMPRSRRAASEVVRIANARERARVSSPSAPRRARKFWLDRARTAAIAKHTNAFKINEDVVIPLERMGEYTDAIERINIELSHPEQARAGRRARAVLRRRAAARAAPTARCPERAAGRGVPRRCSRACGRAGSGCSRRSMRRSGAVRAQLEALGAALPPKARAGTPYSIGFRIAASA